jgi:Permease family
MSDTFKLEPASSHEEDVRTDTDNQQVAPSNSKVLDEGGAAFDSTHQRTFREIALENGMQYTVTDVPPFGTSLLLGLQHYLTMLGATVLIPLIVCPAMGANGSQTAEVISSIFFVSGINTVSTNTDRRISLPTFAAWLLVDQ